ncbi:Globin domain-containing protein [Caenorhabditis elegans]|nr:GLOBIN domain-containing protein [Caenorhabditis elegans]CBW48432.1 GLOBIN domain-containing protein [Caenorhabditis elegans]|eukprot:NP_001256463.1 GLoBin related [Caenorhabditis elegans]
MDHTMMPVISITRTRRCSVSSPLRFTRTFSEDSLDSLEKNGRKELRRQRIMENGGSVEKEKNSLNPLAHTTCPHLGQMGRSRTECPEAESLRLPLTSKRSAGDLSCPPSPTRRNLNEVIGLSPYQQKLLVQCWPNIYTTGASGPFANSLYSTLSSRNAKAKELLAKADGVAVFSKSDFDCSVMHCRVTVEILDTVIKNLDNDHARITQYLTEIGKQHRHLKAEGLSSAVWDDLGDTIMDCARRRCEAVRKHKELRRAWLAIIAYIMDNLKQGQSMTRSSSTYDLSYDSSKVPCTKKNSSN